MSASEVAVSPSTPRLEAKVPLLEADKSVVKVEDQIRQDKTSSISSGSTSPKWNTKSSSEHHQVAKDNSRVKASEVTAGQTASSENCYNHYARNLLLVHK